MGERSYGGRTATERVAERRARLLRATTDLLAERGEARTTMTAVCAEAGLTERYFYESFTGLDAALVAALDAVAERILGLVVRVVEETPGSSEERVRAALRALVDLVTDDPASMRLAVVTSAASPVLHERRDALVGTFADVVVAEATELYGDAAWPTARAQPHALVYVTGLSELVAAWTSGRSELTADEVVEVGAGLFAAVMRRPAGT